MNTFRINPPTPTNILTPNWSITIRSSWRNIGLTAGITGGLIIGIYILHEWSYDRFVPNSERIYRVVQEQNQAGDPLYQMAGTPAPLAEKLRSDYPEVQEVMALSRTSKRLFQNQEQSFEEGNGIQT